MPKLLNKTPFKVEVVGLIDQEGRNVAVVIVKATFEFNPERQFVVAPEQEPLVLADEYVGDPATTSIRVPTDVVFYKPGTDVLLVRPKSADVLAKLKERTISVEMGEIRFGGRPTDSWEFGPIRPDAKPRKSYAGTYDQAWMDQRMPLLPVDFDVRFNQTAPAKQIAKSCFAGDEPFKFANLNAEKEVIEGKLPGLTVVIAGNVLSHYFTEVAALDTILIWADGPKISLVWRHCIKPAQKIAEVKNVYVYLVRLHASRELYGKP